MDPDATLKLPAAKKAKVLLVEDEANIASMVQDWLSETYDVVWAQTGKAALEKAAAEQPAIILEDINLPDMLGYDVVKILEKDSRTAHIPVIFLTGQKMVDETIKFISTVKNVKGYVNKPFKLKDFLEKIALILGHKAEFVVLENAVPTTENRQKAEMMREARATGRKESLGEDPRAKPAAPLSKDPIGSEYQKGGKRGFVRALFSALFDLGLWASWGLLAAGAASELTCRLLEKFVGEWTFLPLAAPTVLSGSTVSLPPGAAWEKNGVSYRVNSMGLRDDEPATDLTGNSRRVFLLGGSFIFGEDLPLNRTVSKRLEALLAKSPLSTSTSPMTTDVLHGALWNLGPADQWAAYERLHERARPDVVVWIVGDPGLIPPSGSRLRRMNAWPAWTRPWIARSRLAGLLCMAYAYGGAPERAPAGGETASAVNRFAAAHPSTMLMIFSLKKGDAPLRGLVEGEKLMVLDASGLGASDVSRKGLTPVGHEALARTIHSTLRQHKDRFLPASAPLSVRRDPLKKNAARVPPQKIRRKKRG